MSQRGLDHYILTKLQMVADEKLGECQFKDDLQKAIDYIDQLEVELENKKTELKLSQDGWAEIHDELRFELGAVQRENEQLRTSEVFKSCLAQEEIINELRTELDAANQTISTLRENMLTQMIKFGEENVRLNNWIEESVDVLRNHNNSLQQQLKQSIEALEKVGDVNLMPSEWVYIAHNAISLIREEAGEESGQ